jgi:hypothetical protein
LVRDESRGALVGASGEVVCRPRIGLKAVGITLMAALSLAVAIIAEPRLHTVVAGAMLMAMFRDFWTLGETVTFAPTRVQRRVQGRGRITWWFDGKAALLYLDGVSEPSRWGLPMLHECLVLVHPGEPGWGRDEIPADSDSLKLLRGTLTNEPEWAKCLLQAIEDERISASSRAATYLRNLADGV